MVPTQDVVLLFAQTRTLLSSDLVPAAVVAVVLVAFAIALVSVSVLRRDVD
jgi:hypothetical protein